jgi:acyl-CoA thioester hydrolase
MATSEPVEADFRFWTEEKLRNADTDKQGHVNNAVMASLFEAGRIEVLESPELAEVRRVTNIVVVKLLIHFRRELFFPGRVKVGTRVPRIGRTSLDFEAAIFAANGVVATAEATCVLLDQATRKPTEVPAAMRAFLTGA